MKYYTDGSRIKAPGATKEEYQEATGVIIGWAAVSNGYPIVANYHFGGSNINAEMFAIRDLVEILAEGVSLPEDRVIEIVTDSKTSIQITNVVMKLSYEEYTEGKEEHELKMNEQSALRIRRAINKLQHNGFEVKFKHVRGHGKDPSMLQEDIEGNALADKIATNKSEYLYNEIEHEGNYKQLQKFYSENRKRLRYVV